MKCPKCGYELTEGHLYCDSCGEEIRIVPDFEPEIEREMNETLSTLFVELAEETAPGFLVEDAIKTGGFQTEDENGKGSRAVTQAKRDREQDTQSEKDKDRGSQTEGKNGKGSWTGKDKDQDSREKENSNDFQIDRRVRENGENIGSEGNTKEKGRKGKKKRGWILVSVCLAFLAVAAGVWGNYSYRSMHSAEYQIKEAEEEAALERYTQAITWLEKAHELEPENAEILFQIADYYSAQGKRDMVLSILSQIIQEPELYGEVEEERAYGKTIEIYEKMEDYQAISQLLAGCGREDIVTEFQQYLAKPPEFSYEGDRYKEVLPLKLSANTSGKIYYTLDGTTPNQTSEVYTAPIFLEPGSYIVTAYFVNDYGIESEVVSNTYHIEVQPPPAPEVSVYSGDYGEPCMIEVEVWEDCTVYYTSDGSEPTIDSSRYTTAISMPLGQSVFQFIAVSPEGAVSEPTVRTYNLVLHTEITVDMAVGNVIQALMRADVLLDENGKLRGMGGRNVYKYNAVVRIEGSGDYYVIYEYYEDATGIQSKTERMYGVDIQTGIACRITYDAEGKIVLVDI